MKQKLPLTPVMRLRAGMLRAGMTPAEQRLWYFLRGRRLLGYKFRRQVPWPPYVLDFYCAELRLVLALDGSQHQQAMKDVIRDDWLAQRGIRVLRFWNNDVMQQTGPVLEVIRLEIEKTVPHPRPLSRGERGGNRRGVKETWH